MLNPQQQEAVHYINGPLLVLAGAGSGKTRVIAQKISHLVDRCEHDPKTIAAITFTNKAAREMQNRVSSLLGSKKAGQLQISTFHSLGVRILRSEAKALGYKPRFSIFDSDDSLSLLQDCVNTTSKAVLRQMQWKISSWKNKGLLPEEAAILSTDKDDTDTLAAYKNYNASLRAYQAVDFDDLIGLPLYLFRQHPDMAEKWQNKLRYFLIDEYQDTNTCQYDLFKIMTGIRSQFTVVGDDDQAIYGWRGADIENLRRLPVDFPELKIIKLEQNYRSTVRILQAANSVISNNEKVFPKKLWSELGLGDPIVVNSYRDDKEEAENIVMKLRAHHLQYRGNFSDYAILYRANHLSRLFETQLRAHHIPYVLSGGQSFFEKTEIKDICSYLRLLVNPEDDPAFIRAATTPKRGIGSATLETLGEYAGKRHLSLFSAAFDAGVSEHLGRAPLENLLIFCHFILRLQERSEKELAHQVMPDLLEAIDYESWLYAQEEERVARNRWTNVTEFVDWIHKKGEHDQKTLADVVQNIALSNRLDKENNNDNAVQLSTLHAAKGLEYKNVFMVGVEDGILPHSESLDADSLEEERRLMYVGITRAKHALHLSWCERRKQGQAIVSAEASRFIAEMGEGITESNKTPLDASANKARADAMLAMLSARMKEKKGGGNG